MKFQVYNPVKQNCDCVIRTFMKLLDKTYINVKEELISLASNLGYESYQEQEVFEKYFEKNGFTKIEEDPAIVNDLSFDSGSYGILCNWGDDYHLFPVIDHTAYDKNDRFWTMDVVSLYRLEK